jgi:hypothetical protein
MQDSPLASSPYEVLGVAATVSDAELKRAYRRQLRLAHPDTGGSAARFDAVQRAWELVSTPERRAAYDRGRPAVGEPAAHAWAPAAPRRRENASRPRTRTHGHPGGRARERYLTLIREWAGRGVELDDPYDPALVRSAPREIRHVLADALAEEATAKVLADLGIAYTVWHDVAVDPGESDEKIDHVVLGPSGLFAVQSEDWGVPVAVRRGELAADGVAETPLRDQARRAKRLGRLTHVRFSAAVVAVPDHELDESFHIVGRSRGMALVVAQISYLPQLLRAGLPDAPRPGGTELFEVRTRVQNGIRFV